MVSKQQQLTYKGVAAGASSGLSMIGSIYILGRYWYARRVKAKTTGASTVHHVDVTKELIHVLAWLDLVGAVGRCFGVLPTQTFDQSKGEPVTGVCQLQAFVITFGDVAPIAWNFLMAYNLFRWVCLGEDQQMLQRRIKWYVLATLVFTLTIDALALAFNKYGDAGQWCWIVVPGDRPNELYWKLVSLYFWVLAGAVAMIVLLVMVKMNVQNRLKGVDNDDARIAYHGVVQNLTIYIVAFILCWCPAVLDRGYSAITGHDVFTLSMLHTSIVPLQGFVNAVIYGKFHVWIGRHLQTKAHDTSMSHKTRSTDTHRPTEEDRRQFGTASIFVTTFDMNWAAFPTNLGEWIPADKDLYVFSLQHCVNVQGVEQAIRKHLLQINYPMGYRSITALAGAQSRGHTQDASVCQIVFVNNSDIASGNFQFQTADGSLWAQRKAFKGVVGIPMRYFEASLAFVSCNLNPIPSNNSSNNNFSAAAAAAADGSLASRHAATASLIHSFEMDADRAAVDFPYLYHHTILSGNLNYNIDLPRSKLHAAIERAHKAERLKRATDAALNAKLKHFGPSPVGVEATKNYNYPAGNINSNVPVEWNLLYFKSRGSLGRASDASTSSAAEDDELYEELFSGDHDGLPFTQLRSPSREGEPSTPLPHVTIDLPSSAEPADRNWRSFLDNLFPSPPSPQPSAADTKKVSAWLTNAQLASDSCQRKWLELCRHDELRAAMAAKETLCGFDEPAITFLPSFPRRVGVAASYAMTSSSSPSAPLLQELFLEDRPPAYKDRVLVHSLPDARPRLRDTGYWLCEAVVTSTHKPVCRELELEIDRFFAFQHQENETRDLQRGLLALKDKSAVHEYKLKLVNLDANLWSYVSSSSTPGVTTTWRLRPSEDGGSLSMTMSMSSSKRGKTRRNSRRSLGGGGGGGGGAASSISSSSTRASIGDPSSPVVELVSIEPASIATIFPLPSEDVYARQRKVHEVAHSVQSGFQSSAHNDQGEEASLAYTNFRSVAWKEAAVHGVTHSAITQAVNGVVHVAIKLQGDTKAQGGQGILCINEQDLLDRAAAVITDAEPIPFDLPLTWGGQHVGYLHGDILSGL